MGDLELGCTDEMLSRGTGPCIDICSTTNYCSGVPDGAYPDLKWNIDSEAASNRSEHVPHGKGDKTGKGMPRGFNFVQALQRKNRLNLVIG